MTEKQWIESSNKLFLLSALTATVLFIEITTLPFFALTLLFSINASCTVYNGSLCDRKVQPISGSLKACASTFIWMLLFFKFQEFTLSFGIAVLISILIFVALCFVSPKPRT